MSPETPIGLENGGGTKRCPLCAEDIKAEAVICRFCGTRLEIIKRGYCTSCHRVVTPTPAAACPECGTAVVDEYSETRPAGAAPASLPEQPAPGPMAPPPPAASVLVREGNRRVVRVQIGAGLANLAGAVAIVVSVLSFSTARDWWAHWGEGGNTYGRAPIGFVLGALVAMALIGFSARLLTPLRSAGRDARREWRRSKVRVLARRGGLSLPIAAALAWVGMLALVIYNWEGPAEVAGWERMGGINISLIACMVGIAGSLLAIRGPNAEAVMVDEAGRVVPGAT